MSKEERTDDRERRTGEVTLAQHRWRWEAVHAPPDDPDQADNPFLRWFEITFRLEEDPAQEAFARAGISPGDWSDETLRQVLRSARTRTWRGPEGRLWSVRLEGWSGQGISTEVAEAENENGPAVIFVDEERGKEVRRSAADLDSITAPGEGGLESVLEEDV